ncbi:putative glycosyltransferase At5g03795 [Nicotiana tabacum]|uniref:Glycosyltransferase At5g03795 n=1 Tax=Nicotiana tabacum TaxID=4097 RepID=A0A1S4A7U7_TOBAC|nr:probable glycosyltransferase At5g03795 [Nicotiana tomentosiformis]XP_016472713.1 PREDICTED: probable glycosyltransferase At5g03795 [Nicotiana tabacum]
MWCLKKLQLPSFLSSNLALLVFIPLFLVSILACTLLGSSFVSSFSSSSSWNGIKSVGILTSYSLRSLSSYEEQDEHLQIVGLAEAPSFTSPFNNSLVTEDSIPHQPPQEGESQNEKDEISIEREEHGNNATAGVVKMYSRLERVEAILAKARSSIREAARNGSMISSHQDPDYVPQGPMYHNANSFHRSYLEMEKNFKAYVYEEGEPPIFHNGPCRSIYSTEGRFIHEMEKGNFYRTKDPDEAMVYFLPFSVVVMVHYLYVPGAHDMHTIGTTVADYVKVISSRHTFWNRSLGADHFMLSCHDWGPRSTSYVPHLFNNSIRVLCNANTSEGFNPIKDVSLPEIHLKTGDIKGLIGGPSPSTRSILAFFAGGLHGNIRHHLLKQWKGKDEDVLVYEKLPRSKSYESMLKKSKFCLCPSGYEVASPRVVEAIYAECIPVLISDSYVPPFSDVLNWKSFSVTVAVKDIPNIKKILMSISQSQYLRMHRRVKQVQRHFVINGPPKRFDLFHMTVHSIWLRRLNIRVHE